MARKNELHPDLLGAGSLNPWEGHDSSSRKQMFTSHLGQCLVVSGATPRRTLTGMEYEYGKYTFSIQMPCDATIIRCIEHYPKSLGQGGFKENPHTVVIYEDVETKQVGILNLSRYHYIHQHFGFRYVYKAAVNKLYPGANIAKGTIIADSPSVDTLGNYTYGLESETVFASLPAVIEDGVIVSESYLERLRTLSYGTRVTSWGKKQYPLNLYGDENEYKPFPDIGEYVREDGLLLAMRDYNDLLAPIEMTPKALQKPDYIYDHLMYAEPGAKIVDVRIHHDRSGKNPTPVGMTDQLERYERATSNFHASILEEYHKLKRRRKDALRLTPQFHRTVVEALSDTGENNGQRVQRTHKRNPLDDWRVEITFEHEVKPCIGFKLTDTHGGKGVICDIMKTEDMPVDAAGNRAEIIMDGDSSIKRMNLGRLYEQYINASAREATREVERLLGRRTQREIKQAWKYLLGFYKIVSQSMYEIVQEKDIAANPIEHLEEVVKDGIYIHLPTDNERESTDIVRNLRKYYPPVYGPVTYRGRSGNVVNTVNPILIGSVYFMMLEKTGSDWSAVSSAKLQHFGIPAKLTSKDKYSTPARNQPVRIMGEDESRLISAVCGGETTAEILDQSNNPRVHKEIVNAILHTDTPTNIDSVVDRNKIPRGQSRPLVFIKHILECSGVRFAERKDKE